MGFWDVLLLLITFAMLGLAGYLFVHEMHVEDVQYNEFVAKTTINASDNTRQFYSNMRFPSKDIGYMIEAECSEANKIKIVTGLKEIDDKTSVSFHPSNNPDIIYECSSKAPSAEEKKNHLVAGAARPRFINASKFYVIQQTNVSLYVEESCEKPIVVIHETLHSLGFDHVNDESDVMYPIAKCDQEISADTISEINRLYAIPQDKDLVILDITANTTRRYLNFGISAANYGLKDAENTKLYIMNGEELVQEFDLGDIGIGQTKTLSVQNLKIPEADRLKFIVKDGESTDLDPDDNEAFIVSSSTG